MCKIWGHIIIPPISIAHFLKRLVLDTYRIFRFWAFSGDENRPRKRTFLSYFKGRGVTLQPWIFLKQFFELWVIELRVMTRTCANISGEVFGPCADCCPCEAMEQKKQKTQTLTKGDVAYSNHSSCLDELFILVCLNVKIE